MICKPTKLQKSSLVEAGVSHLELVKRDHWVVFFFFFFYSMNGTQTGSIVPFLKSVSLRKRKVIKKKKKKKMVKCLKIPVSSYLPDKRVGETLSTKWIGLPFYLMNSGHATYTGMKAIRQLRWTMYLF